MIASRSRARLFLYVTVLLATAVAAPACGGGAGGAGPDGAGQGLVLVSFLQSGQDNVPINRQLSFEFSEPIMVSSINAGSLQILEGPDFGRTIAGEFSVDGATVSFRPRLPTDCTLADAGLQPDTQYRVMVMGFPEEFSVKNSQGQPLESTQTYEFHTRPDTDPDFLEDQIPAVAPGVVATTPVDQEAAVAVMDGNEIVVQFTENLNPCTINDSTVRLEMWEVGAPGTQIDAGNGRFSGFDPFTDSDGSAFSWGATNSTAVSPAQRIPAQILLQQDYAMTEIRIRPSFGKFPENALLVLQLSFGIQDFGGDPLPPTTISFTTENLPQQSGMMEIDYEQPATPVDLEQTTADLDTARSPGLVQGWLLFAGDGDNGSNLTIPAFPITPGNCNERINDFNKDDFDPSADIILNTGTSRNTCANLTDGSTAVVWQFRTFQIRSGVTVRLTGNNPAIILVQGAVTIYSGGTLRVRADGSGGAPQGRGDNGQGYNYPTYPDDADGGRGMAGAGNGGDAWTTYRHSSGRGFDGYVGYGSPDYNTGGEQGGHGAGQGNIESLTTTSNSACGAAGGGGGHAVEGITGMAVLHSTMTWVGAPVRGAGGEVYPDGTAGTRLYAPAAGSGGGGGGELRYSTSVYYKAPGGAGGAGGGFVDVTAGGNINVYGTIDAAGSRGGNGGTGGYGNYLGGGGGGGGSGGGIRLLTPADIDIGGGTLSAAGGQGGTGGLGTYSAAGAVRNNGGAGGHGRIVLEDGDSIISGITSANLSPNEGQDGFYRGTFDASRFQGGGLDSTATTGLMLLGPLSPATFLTPTDADFITNIPTAASRGLGMTSMMIEIQGFGINPDGTPNMGTPTGWFTIGYFSDSGSAAFPQFVEGSNPGDVPIPAGNAGVGVASVNGSAYVQVRVSFFLPTGIGATEPGPYMDWTRLRFTYDQ